MTSSTRTIASYRESGTPRVSVVVPAMNEARNLEVLLPELAAALTCHEVILVDGGSADDTVATARRVLPGVRVVRQVRTGKGNALAAGFAAVTGDIVVTLDADMSADPSEVGRFVAALEAGADVATGSRFAADGASEDITALRAWGNRALGGVFNLLFRRRCTDLCYGFNAFWADMVPVLDLPDHRVMTPQAGQKLWGDGFEIETVLACRFAAAGAVVVEVGSTERRRAFGRSHLNTLTDGSRVLRTLAVEWLRARPRPARTRAAAVVPVTSSIRLAV